MASMARYFWEEFLGVGAVLLGLGLWKLWTLNRRLLAGILCWIVPVLGVTTLFKIEGQHDLWFMSAWMPLWLVAGLGLTVAARRREVVAGLAIAGVVWAAVANRADLDQRNYTLAESTGHLQLDEVDRDAVLLLYSDDTLSTSLYLQRVKGVRPDVLIVQSPLLGPAADGGPGWYDAALQRLNPGLQPSDYAGLGETGMRCGRLDQALAAFVRSNAPAGRPIFLERAPGPELLPSGFTIVPAGHLLKIVPRDQRRIEAKYWKSPVEAESLPPQYRRERGQYIAPGPGGITVRPEAYERRLLRELLRARKNLADWRALSGTADGLERSVELYESILALDPWMKEDAGAVVPLARSYCALKRFDRAEPLLRLALTLELPGRIRGQLCALLAEICASGGRESEAARWKAAALAEPDLPDDLRAKLR
jgi:tetratricopeptide (TPR) repeat protein